MLNSSKITSLPNYKNIPEAYELEQHSRPDEMVMLNSMNQVIIKNLNHLHEATVIDLCCGTGLSIETAVDHPNVSLLAGVDISEQFLRFASHRFLKSNKKPTFIHGDAVSVALPRNCWDMVILSSAYHHIENNRKLSFLCRVRRLIGNKGVAVLAENVLPEYQEDNNNEFFAAIDLFYNEVLRTAQEKNSNLSVYAANLIRRVAKYCRDREYEYKVNYSILKNHLAEANLHVVSERRVWPWNGPMLETKGGNYIMTITGERK